MDPRKFRTSRDLTLADMAKLVGAANGSTVSKHERGLIFPSPNYVEAYRTASAGKIQYEDWVEVRERRARRTASTPALPTPCTL